MRGFTMTNISLVSKQAMPVASNDSRRFDELSLLVSEVTRELRDLNVEFERSAMMQRQAGSVEVPAGMDLRIDVRSARKLRNLRKRIFGNDIYSGPAWDILLHLFESHVMQRRDTVGNVTDGAELPCATGIRWIARLGQEGLVSLSDDHFDRRRRFVELSASGAALMTRYFCGAAPNLVAA